MDVLGCNKATTMIAEQAIEKHQMNLQKGAGGQKLLGCAISKSIHSYSRVRNKCLAVSY